MRKWWLVTLVTFIITNALWLCGLSYFHTKKVSDPVLAQLDPQVRQYYKSKIVTVTAGRYVGSGCEIEPEYFLTALHVIGNALLDDHPIAVGSKPAKLIFKGTTEEDYAILSTAAKPDLSKANLPYYDFQEGEDFVVTGNPGNQIARVQTGKIASTVVKNETGTALKPNARLIFTDYVEAGISGGCVYPMGWLKPVGVAIKSEGDAEKRKGEISLARKRIE